MDSSATLQQLQKDMGYSVQTISRKIRSEFLNRSRLQTIKSSIHKRSEDSNNQRQQCVNCSPTCHYSISNNRENPPRRNANLAASAGTHGLRRSGLQDLLAGRREVVIQWLPRPNPTGNLYPVFILGLSPFFATSFRHQPLFFSNRPGPLICHHARETRISRRFEFCQAI